MKILKIKYCNETSKNCFYLKDNLKELQYECRQPEIVKKSKGSKFISKRKRGLNIKIPDWCPLEDYKRLLVSVE